MLINFLFLILFAFFTIVAVKYCILNGLGIISRYSSIKDKTKGQIVGYITSLPEFVVVLASAIYGVIDAGFWNIVASNIINIFLFILASIVYGKTRCLMDKSFRRNIFWIIISIIVPLSLFQLNVQLSIFISCLLLLLFIIYKIDESRANHIQLKEEQNHMPTQKQGNNLSKGLLLLFIGSVMIIFCGIYLGKISSQLVLTLHIPAWMIGWLVGLITSFPEMGSFFEIFKINYQDEKDIVNKDKKNTQIGIEALLISNLSNLCLILPLGIMIAYCVSRFKN